MSGKSLKQGINIGTSSLILIFIVLCLTTFGLLSLSSAKGDLQLAEKNKITVSGYYEADRKGQEFLQEVDGKLKTVLDVTESKTVAQAPLIEKLGSYYDWESDVVRTEIPMERGQALHIELKLVYNKDVRYQVEAWKVMNTEDYEIDDSMPVWTGEEIGEK